MSTSLLYHGFGIRGYQYVKTEYEGGQVVFTVCQKRKRGQAFYFVVFSFLQSPFLRLPCLRSSVRARLIL